MGISANQARLLTLTARQHDLELRAQQISARKMVLSLQSQGWATKYSEALNAYASRGQQVSNGHWEFEYETITAEWLKANGNAQILKRSDKSAYPSNDYSNIDFNVYGIYKKVTTTTTTPGTPAGTFSTVREYAEAAGMNDDAVKTSYINALVNEYQLGLGVHNFNNSVSNSGTEFSLDNFVIDGTKMYYPVSIYPSYPVELSSVFPGVSGSTSGTPGSTTTTTSYVEISRPVKSSTWVSDSTSTEVGEVDLEAVKAEYDSAVKQLSSIEKLLDMELTQVNTEHEAVKTEYDSIKSLISDNVDKSFNVFG